MAHRRCPIPSPELAQLKSAGPPALHPPFTRRQLHSEPHGDLVQMIGQAGPTGRWPKEQIADPSGLSVKPRGSILHLLEFDSQLTHYLHVEGVVGRASKHRLRGRGHHHPKRGKFFDHLGMAEGHKPHPLR
jgi:hypothetical protein